MQSKNQANTVVNGITYVPVYYSMFISREATEEQQYIIPVIPLPEI